MAEVEMFLKAAGDCAEADPKGVGLEHFFVDDELPTIAVVRKADRLRLPNAAGDKSPRLFL